MVTDMHNMTLPGMEEMHLGLREITCECGCGQTFFQTKVGRVKKYVDAKHKAAAYRERKEKQVKPLIGDTVKELVDYLRNCYDGSAQMEWLSPVERGAIHALYDFPELALFCDGLNALQERYCR